MLVNFSCDGTSPSTCPKSENMGWRYLYITVGGLCLVMAIVRATVLGARESPKWLVSVSRIEEAVKVLNEVSHLNGSDYRVTISQFTCRPQDTCHQTVSFKHNFRRVGKLFSGKKQARLMACLILLWSLVGIWYVELQILGQSRPIVLRR